MQLSDIKGLGVKRIDKLKEANIFTPIDLLYCFPNKYIDLSTVNIINSACEGDEVAIDGTIVTKASIAYIGSKRKCIITAKINIDSNIVSVKWFNQPYIARNLCVGKRLQLLCKVRRRGRQIELNVIRSLDFTYSRTGILPLYKRIDGLPYNMLYDAIDKTLTAVHIRSFIPDEIFGKFGICNLDEAIKNIHHPRSLIDIESSKRAVAVYKLAMDISAFSIAKQKIGDKRKFFYSHERERLQQAIGHLPFRLTEDQSAVVDSIVDKLHSANAMNALIEGDVGCGKTIVAFLIMLYSSMSGFQSVIMAPTEILALQHYNKAVEFFGNYGYEVVLLTAGLSKQNRNQVISDIADGKAKIIVGTHSLLSDDVNFDNLSLVIIDEQQRFGVNQRGKLENKAPGCDVAVMTATPIPRTLALTLYGDLDLYSIRVVPERKAKIITVYVPEKKIDDMYSYLAKKAQDGEQSYIVCPRIDDEENSDLISAQALYESTAKGVFNGICGLLHGKMKDSAKAAVMNDFISGKIKILIATTVVEVGVDVPQATNIVIYNSERYGLSQLHQLRGRVGRGTVDSYCFVLSGEQNSERIRHFIECSDGFELAERDFCMRGAGDFIGDKQHGVGSMSNIFLGLDEVKLSKKISDYILGDEQFVSEFESNIKDIDYIKELTLN